ncbi:hypothetical protein [Proteiniclasticum sp. QWL-01]|uniref:hypothetical protein n=1 Tax=Proteiniclasticum sp. QWL-01 TaxID=3036945 RepID=UPI002410D5B2|nr:hypothetical protein [Proteiniclasticum sp. QWL-01]WFF73653.1 hypothetical protein P6M73_04160 [Proteiniclasticum sp. QWL-01]
MDREQEVRNLLDKLVCLIDEENQAIVIVRGPCKTIIKVNESGTLEVKNVRL